jgi:TusA-related sulfurtransferase/predicted peroxiredoxin
VIVMPVETRTRNKEIAQVPARRLDLRGKTITTAIVFAVQDELKHLAIGDELELTIEPFPAIVPDLEAWCRATGNRLVETRCDGESWQVRVRKGVRCRSDHRLAIVVSEDGLEELLSPLGFALAAALSGTQVALYLQGPAVHVLAPGFRPRLHGLSRPFSRFARAGLEKTGHVSPAEKLRELQALRATVYACGPSLQHFRVDPDRLAFDGVIVCEYLTFLEAMQHADVQLYA